MGSRQCHQMQQRISPYEWNKLPDPRLVAAPGSPLTLSFKGWAGWSKTREKRHLLIYLSGCARTDSWHSRIPKLPCAMRTLSRSTWDPSPYWGSGMGPQAGSEASSPLDHQEVGYSHLSWPSHNETMKLCQFLSTIYSLSPSPIRIFELSSISIVKERLAETGANIGHLYFLHENRH